ncbi:P-loop containing nucleoside triphosphate hydrolase protein [Mycena maculata]|uniref:P-loop containing nucleoside triphosphate hydrolase protein n=1 Tax=Mycena maculata TaxID=230809 RepID=A0AAD7NF60_9AGAR|nr:P-loop containing nucleoside triphosphate hydrolase protein [Mycena maculata]
MAKCCAVDSDDENTSVGGSPASKRAHTAVGDDEDAPCASGRRASKGKPGKARRRDNDDEEARIDYTGDNEEEDRKFEEDNTPHILASLNDKHKVHGGIADHGIIESIEMHRFMCHKYLTFSFGPQINFIQYSAVLSAITVALGGKANSTGRGNSLKSFIQEGQTYISRSFLTCVFTHLSCRASEVTLSLKNQGEEVYKPKKYGKSIVITRRFTKVGNSSWKIKSKDGKVISTKKDELAAICDHMNIQVDNPMNVLMQEKYKARDSFVLLHFPDPPRQFFLRGTQLSQLSDKYDTCFVNITATTKMLAQKKEAIPDLRTVFREASTRFEEAEKAREQKNKVDELKKELVWARINSKEEEMKAKFEAVAKLAGRLSQIQENLEKAELQAKKDEIAAQIRVKKGEIAILHNSLKDIDEQLKRMKKEIEAYTATIGKETKRLEKASESKRGETQQKLEGARADVKATEDALSAINTQISSAEDELKHLREDGATAENAQQKLDERIRKCNINIQSCLSADTDHYGAYSNNIQGVMERINQTTWHGEKPLGPLGIHVKVWDNKWVELLRFMLLGLLCSFAVTDARDIRVLKKILAGTNNPKTSVHFFKPDLFDYSSGEPLANVLTVLRALEVSDPHVLRILINKTSIKSRVLAPRRVEAQGILTNMRSGSAWTIDGFNVTRYPEGGESLVPIHIKQLHAMLLVQVRSTATQLQRWRDKKVEFDHQLQTANATLAAAQQKWNEARQGLDALKACHSMGQTADDTFHEAKCIVLQIQNEIIEEMPAQLSFIRDALQDSEREKEVIMAQFTEISKQKATLNGKQKELVTQSDEISGEIRELRNYQGSCKAAENRTDLLNDVNHWKKKIAEEEAKVKEAEDNTALIQTEFTEWTTKAQEYCERVPTKRSPDAIDRSLKSTQAALVECEKRHGASMEDMAIEMNKAEDRLEKAEEDLKHLTKLNKALQVSLIVRLLRWQEFRRLIALRCKLVFGYHLSQRGYFGKVLFDHKKSTLQLKVQHKDPRSLSGGEKSFSTICLLLSLWDSIGCPLRCLDEFDVFMDAVNRCISIKMMIDTANQSDKKQYVLITPQDMHNVNPGPTVRVHRMTDPKRGQGVRKA